MTVAPAIVSPIAITTVSESLAVNKEVISRLESLSLPFWLSLEARFTAIDNCFSQVMVSSASSYDNARPNVSCQDLFNSSIPAPITPVAVRDKHPPARAPYAPYSEGLGKSREGPATESSPTGVASFPYLAFTKVVDRVRVYESSVGYAPDSYLTSPRLRLLRRIRCRDQW